MSHSSTDGKLSVIQMHYLIGTSGGVQHFAETHELGLFTVKEMQDCFKKANLAVEYDPEGIYNRGLYIARKA